MSGYVGNLSSKQEEALRQFREQAADLLGKDDSDYTCLRWLRARNFDVQQAKGMLKKHVAWRKQHGIDTILKDYQPRPFLKKNIPGGLIGFDKNGGPTWLYPMRNVIVKALLRGASTAEILRLMMYRCEASVKHMEEQSRKLGRNIETHTIIFDFGDFPILQAVQPDAVSLITGFVSMYESNYPERMQETIIINAPSLFSLLFNLIKPLLTGRTLQKVSIFGKDNWKDYLLERVDADVLPKHWGGNVVDENGDPECPALVNMPTLILEEEYKGSRMTNADEVTWVTVDRRACHEVPVTVPDAGSLLCWEFVTEQHDVGFAVARRASPDPDGSEEEEVRPWKRAEAHVHVQEGSVVCKKPGTYFLKFDNTFSAYRSKKVGYSVRVLPGIKEEQHSTDF